MAQRKLEIRVPTIDASQLDKLDKIPAKLRAINDEEEKLSRNRQTRNNQPPTPTARQMGAIQAGAEMGPAMPSAAEWRTMDRLERQRRQSNDAAYIEQMARSRSRYTPNAWGGQSGHILGVDRAKLQAAGLGHVIRDIEGAGPPPVSPQGVAGAITNVATGNYVGAASGVLGGAGMAGGALGAGAVIAGAALIALAAGARYATQTVKGLAIAGEGYNPRFEQFGISAGSLGGNLTGLQAALGMRAGINPIGGYFGDNNYGAKQKKALDFIRNAPSFNEARRRAEGLGMPEAASAWYLDQENFDDMSGRQNPDEGQRRNTVNRDARIEGAKDKTSGFLANFADLAIRTVEFGYKLLNPGDILPDKPKPKSPPQIAQSESGTDSLPYDISQVGHNRDIRGSIPKGLIGNTGMDGRQADYVRLGF